MRGSAQQECNHQGPRAQVERDSARPHEGAGVGPSPEERHCQERQVCTRVGQTGGYSQQGDQAVLGGREGPKSLDQAQPEEGDGAGA